jgi:hypothetical protein
MMSHFDDETIMPTKSGMAVKFVVTTDTILVAVGVLLAAGSAFLPWYVILNPEKFKLYADPRIMTRDMPDTGPRPIWNVSPMAIPNKDEPKLASLPLDPLKTGTTPIAPNKMSTLTITGSQKQPNGFSLLHVSNGKALIKDDKGIYLVQVGSPLPDQSKLATIEELDGKPVIITTNGTVIGQDH